MKEKKNGVRFEVSEHGEFAAYATAVDQPDYLVIEGSIDVMALRESAARGESPREVSGTCTAPKGIPADVLHATVAMRAALAAWLWADMVNAALALDRVEPNPAPRRQREPSIRRGRRH